MDRQSKYNSNNIFNSVKQYFDNTSSTPIVGAGITVSRNDGVIFNFSETREGIYQWSPNGDETLGTSENTFNLKIEVNGKEYTSSTAMNRVPPIDSLIQEFVEGELFQDDGIYVEFFARDIPGNGDAYWIKSFKDDRFLNRASELNISYDGGFDAGSQIDGVIFIPPIRDFINELSEDDLPTPWNVGEVSRVEIHSLSQEAFNFLEIARDQINNGGNGIFSLPLANTRTNITNSTGGLRPLGHFNVAAVSRMEITIE